jgi:single-stranded-DNA-specific exonuclease
LVVSCNLERKEIVKNVSFNSKYTLSSEHGICLRTEEFAGLSGLFANKVMREKGVPVAIFSKDDINPENLVGSLRAPEGYRVDEFLKKYQNLLVAGGGHERAAGLTIREKDYYLICTMFISECSKQALEMKKSEEKSINITLEDINEANYHVYESFMPFGEGFPAPTFKVTVEKEKLVLSPSHKAIFATTPDRQGQVILFDHIDEIVNSSQETFDIYGSLSLEIYKNTKKIKLIGNKIL